MATTKEDDKATLAEQLNPHGAAFAERQKAPALYDDPTIATPGKLKGVEDYVGPHALVEVDEEVGENDPDNPVDVSVDNRSEVQAVLELGETSLQDKLVAQVERVERVAEEQGEGIDAADLTGGPQVRQQGAVKKPSTARGKTS